MSTAISSYGAGELRRLSHRYWVTGLFISIALHGMGIGALFTLCSAVSEPAVLPPHHKPDIRIFADPDRLTGFELPRLSGRLTHSQHSPKGLPFPVPDKNILSDTMFAANEEFPGTGDPGGEEGTGETTVGIPPADTAPPPFVPYQKEPEIVRSIMPEYPPIALMSGVEGKVVASMWVDVRGRVRQVRILSSSNDVFNDAALEAGRQFVFTPAIMNDRPVAVWVAVPFRFRIVDARK